MQSFTGVAADGVVVPEDIAAQRQRGAGAAVDSAAVGGAALHPLIDQRAGESDGMVGGEARVADGRGAGIVLEKDCPAEVVAAEVLPVTAGGGVAGKRAGGDGK